MLRWSAPSPSPFQRSMSLACVEGCSEASLYFSTRLATPNGFVREIQESVSGATLFCWHKP